jgi:hypothetical protein
VFDPRNLLLRNSKLRGYARLGFTYAKKMFSCSDIIFGQVRIGVLLSALIATSALGLLVCIIVRPAPEPHMQRIAAEAIVTCVADAGTIRNLANHILIGDPVCLKPPLRMAMTPT